MNTYLIDPRNNGGEQFTVEAADIGAAAQIAARKIHPKISAQISHDDRTYFAQRETGSLDGSGMFRVWRGLRGAGHQQSDYGSAFHVMEL